VLAAMVVPKKVAARLECSDSLSAMGSRVKWVLGTTREPPGTVAGTFCVWS